jgi:hypothetical protein
VPDGHDLLRVRARTCPRDHCAEQTNIEKIEQRSSSRALPSQFLFSGLVDCNGADKKDTLRRIGETAVKPKVTAISDLQVVAAMVTKVLRDQHGIDEAPAPGDYRVAEGDTRLNGSTDILVGIKLARGLAIDVGQLWWTESDRTVEALVEAATEIAEDIALVHNQHQEIIEMATEVRAAITREIAKAKRRGLPYSLVSATPNAVYDRVGEGIIIDFVFQQLSESLRPEQAKFRAACAADVVAAFDGCREVQEQRLSRRAQLIAAGATGRIDSVVVNAMQDAGHNMAEVLKLLVTADDGIVDIGEGDGDMRLFRLHWNNGDVYAHITLGDGASWHEGRLTFQKAPVSPDNAKGRRVRDIVDNPIFGDVRVRSGSGKKGKSMALFCTQDLLHFDADTGRLWAA